MNLQIIIILEMEDKYKVDANTIIADQFEPIEALYEKYGYAST